MSDWLTRRTPQPPPELAAAMRSAISSANPTPTELLAAAQALLAKVLKTECAQRDSALDLLTADALITYALELANETDAHANFAEAALTRLAATQ